MELGAPQSARPSQFDDTQTCVSNQVVLIGTGDYDFSVSFLGTLSISEHQAEKSLTHSTV